MSFMLYEKYCGKTNGNLHITYRAYIPNLQLALLFSIKNTINHAQNCTAFYLSQICI